MANTGTGRSLAQTWGRRTITTYNPKFDKRLQAKKAAAKTVAPAAKSTAASASLAKARDLYAPGGAYSKGLDAQLARGSKKAVAGGTQALVSSGLASTSMGAGLAKQYEEEVGAPARADLESRRVSAMAGLYSQEAGMQVGASESAAGRQFAGGQAELDRGLTREMGAASRGTTLATAAMSRPQATMSQFPSASAPAQAPVAGQHIAASGLNSFLQNLKSSDIMSTPSWQF